MSPFQPTSGESGSAKKHAAGDLLSGYKPVAGAFDAIVTAPLQKSTINDAGVPFTGHTEYLAERTHTPRVVMMLAGLYAERTGDHATIAELWPAVEEFLAKGTFRLKERRTPRACWRRNVSLGRL